MPLRLEAFRLPLKPPKLSPPRRLFSYSSNRRGQFSLLFKGSDNNLERYGPDLRQEALNEIELYAERFKSFRHLGSDYSADSHIFEFMTPPEESDSVLVLGSRRFIPWLLKEPGFISGVLGRLFFSSPSWGGRPSEINVVLAISDALGPDHEGIAVLHGRRESILPTLHISPSPLRNDDTAALTFQINPMDKIAGAGKLSVTMPLANTVFETGSPSVLLHSLWARDKHGDFSPGDWSRRQTLDVIPETTRLNAPDTVARANLVAITPPRKIMSGLGNIIRQIEVDGKVVPASKELEKNITDLVANQPNPGPVEVWACILPSSLVEDSPALVQGLFSERNLSPSRDNQASVVLLPPELLARGSRIYKVLSGGGGWGTKQGLLSLDPESRFAKDDTDAEMKKFMESFASLWKDGASTGIVTPGHYIQFFVTPFNPLAPLTRSLVTVLGSWSLVSPGVGGDEEGGGSLSMIIGHFGIASSRGVFLQDGGKLECKINAPGSYLEGRWES